jgi:hypothetical protein
MMDLADGLTEEQQKRLRAVWIREAALKLLVASFSTERMHTPAIFSVNDLAPPWQPAEVTCWGVASRMWDKYLEEAKNGPR